MTATVDASVRRRTLVLRRRSASDHVSAPAAARWPASVLWLTGAVAVLALWVVGYAVGLSRLQEQHTQHVLYAQLRQQLAQQVAPPRLLPSGHYAPVRPGEPVALLTIAKAGLRNAVVVQGTRSGDLTAGPGHLPGTVLPGERGVTWILGRSATFGAPFAHLGSLRPGDRITVTDGLGVFQYVVDRLRHPGDVIRSSTAPSSLVLGTSVGHGWRSGWAPTQALYVDASLVGAAQPATAEPQQVSSADGVMHGDPAALVLLFLWLLALTGAVFTLVWTRSRWGGWQSWVAGAPVVIASLWGASDAMLRLLPNVI